MEEMELDRACPKEGSARGLCCSPWMDTRREKEKRPPKNNLVKNYFFLCPVAFIHAQITTLLNKFHIENLFVRMFQQTDILTRKSHRSIYILNCYNITKVAMAAPS